MTARVATIYKKKESLLAMEKYVGKPVIVHCDDGRVITGVLKGFDSNVNLVVANATEQYPGFADQQLGAVIVRGSAVVDVVPKDGTVQIPNPFV